MKKLDIERMQRLEEIVARQTLQLETAAFAEARLEEKNLKLQGANEALTNLILQLKKG